MQIICKNFNSRDLMLLYFRLEEADFIWRYSWFHHRYNPEPPDETTDWWLDPINTLVEFDSPKLTRVGEAYDKAYHKNK